MHPRDEGGSLPDPRRGRVAPPTRPRDAFAWPGGSTRPGHATPRVPQRPACARDSPTRPPRTSGTSCHSADSPTSTYTRRAGAASCPPEIAATRSNWNAPRLLATAAEGECRSREGALSARRADCRRRAAWAMSTPRCDAQVSAACAPTPRSPPASPPATRPGTPTPTPASWSTRGSRRHRWRSRRSPPSRPRPSPRAAGR